MHATAADDAVQIQKAADTDAVPTVTVSATRRDASLQSVPIAVTVLDGEALAQANRNSTAPGIGLMDFIDDPLCEKPVCCDMQRAWRCGCGLLD